LNAISVNVLLFDTFDEERDAKMMKIKMKLINTVSSTAEIICLAIFLFIDGCSGIEMINIME